MAKYRQQFSLDIRDIELIETALRGELSRRAAHSWSNDSAEPADGTLIKELNLLLAKIYHQKMFYSQVHNTGIPSG